MRGWSLLIGGALVVNLGLFLYHARGPLPAGSASLSEPPGRGIVRIDGEDREPPFAVAPLDLEAMHTRSRARPAPADAADTLSPEEVGDRATWNGAEPDAPLADGAPAADAETGTDPAVTAATATPPAVIDIDEPPEAAVSNLSDPAAEAEVDEGVRQESDSEAAPQPGDLGVEPQDGVPDLALTDVPAEPAALDQAVEAGDAPDTAEPQVPEDVATAPPADAVGEADESSSAAAELEPDPEPVVAESAPPTATEPPISEPSPPLVAPLCGVLGDFASATARDAAVEWLEAAGFEISVSPASEAVVSGYWVMIPAPPDRASSLDTVRRLRAAGVKDVWRFTEGEWRNAISLGLFRSKANAERRRAQVERRGFAVALEPRFDGTEAYRIEYRAQATAVRIEDIREQFGDREQTDLACE